MYDLIIKNGYIIDGTGNDGFKADIRVKDGKIAKIHRAINEDAREIIDATGLTVSPGFIDSHSHDDLICYGMPSLWHKLEQGVTTEITGMCGFSCAPVSDTYFDLGMTTIKNLMHDGVFPDNEHTKSYSDYVKYMGENRFGPNVAGYIGHNTIRVAVMGYEDRDATSEELEKMKTYVKDAMKRGRRGISLGLYYVPGRFSRTEEAIELCKVAKEYGGTMTLHMRDENDFVEEGVKETIRIAKESGITTVISHLKVCDKWNWGKSVAALRLIDDAIADGCDIFMDQYPYPAGATVLNCRLPSYVLGMDFADAKAYLADKNNRTKVRDDMIGNTEEWEYFSTLMIGASPRHPELSGTVISDSAKKLGIMPSDLYCDLMVDDTLSTGGIFLNQSEEDLRRIMKHPRTMVGTDGLFYPGAEGTHPRRMASFPRVLGYYTREEGVLELKDAIRKITGLPSMIYGLEGKGILRVGMDADITVFNADTIKDNADYVHCFDKASGINYVIVGGNIVVKDAVYNGGLYGKYIPMK